MKSERIFVLGLSAAFMGASWVRRVGILGCLAAARWLCGCNSAHRESDRQQRYEHYVSILQSLPKRMTRAQLYKALAPVRAPETELPLMTPDDPRRPVLTEWYPIDADFELKFQILHHQGMDNSPKDEALLDKASIEKRRPDPTPPTPPPKWKGPITFNTPYFNTAQLSKEDRQTLALLKKGMTRRQMDQYFAQNGGLYFPPVETHFLPETRLRENAIIAVDIAFKPAAMDEATVADPERRSAWCFKHHWIGDPDDVVKAFSKPYESHIAID